jgi:uncharacterized membrane protein SpoIIM required for sporulation
MSTLWAGILPHGSCELTAIFIDGGAGFLIGWSLIHPGNLSRRDALLVNTKEACKMLIGTVPLYIIAGIIEGNVSHSSIPQPVKFALAAALFSMILFYVYGGWSKRENAGGVGAAHERPAGASPAAELTQAQPISRG